MNYIVSITFSLLSAVALADTTTSGPQLKWGYDSTYRSATVNDCTDQASTLSKTIDEAWEWAWENTVHDVGNTRHTIICYKGKVDHTQTYITPIVLDQSTNLTITDQQKEENIKRQNEVAKKQLIKEAAEQKKADIESRKRRARAYTCPTPRSNQIVTCVWFSIY